MLNITNQSECLDWYLMDKKMPADAWGCRTVTCRLQVALQSSFWIPKSKCCQRLGYFCNHPWSISSLSLLLGSNATLLAQLIEVAWGLVLSSNDSAVVDPIACNLLCYRAWRIKKRLAFLFILVLFYNIRVVFGRMNWSYGLRMAEVRMSECVATSLFEHVATLALLLKTANRWLFSFLPTKFIFGGCYPYSEENMFVNMN